MNLEPANSESHGIWPLAIVFLFWIAILGSSILAYGPPAPLDASAPENKFSAARARPIHELLVGDSIPHPAGSPQNEVVRTRIVGLLESWGYEVEIQSGVGKVAVQLKDRSPDRDQVELHNIIARRSGTAPGKAIMVVAHYDSVPFGPGACDDGAGMAALLEIARMLAAEPEPKREVVFLMTDGEEFGMLGATLFVRQHPLAKNIGIAINLEARGSTGPSCMFETSRQSRQLIPIFARSGRTRFASSLFFEIYKRLKRDTDFSVLQQNGILGYNFAFIGDVKNYHTAADNLENADPGSLQHHGENALGLIRELQQYDQFDLLCKNPALSQSQQQREADEAVYFDVMGRWIVWWPSHWSAWLSYLAFAMFAAAAWKFQEINLGADNETSRFARGLFSHLLIHLLAVVAVIAVGKLIHAAVRHDPHLGNPWPLQPVPILMGYWFTGFALVGAIAVAFSKWLSPRLSWYSFCTIWLSLALATSILASGASHLFIAPMIVTSAFALIVCWFGQRGFTACVVATAIAVGFIWLPMERIFYDAVGFKMPNGSLIKIAMVSMTLTSQLSLASIRTRFGFSILMTVAAVVSFVAAVFLNAVP